MAGLLAEIDGIDIGANVGPALAQQGAALGGIADQVRALIEGNAPLDALLGAIGRMPLPPGLDVLAALGPAIGNAASGGNFDAAALVGPMVAPLQQLAQGGFSVSVSIDIGAALAVVREIVRLVTGTAPGGPQGMPDGPQLLPFRHDDLPPMDDLRAGLAEARAMIDALGPRLDFAKLLELLRRASGGFLGPARRWPPIPLLDEAMEAFAETEAWRAMDGAALSARLDGTLRLVAQVIALPRSRVADPAIAACTLIAAAPAMLDAIGARVLPVLASLRTRANAGNADPSAAELALVVEAASAVSALAAAAESLPEQPASDLTSALLGSLRALSPAVSPDGPASRIDRFIASIPNATPDPLAPLRTGVEQFDVSTLAAPFQAVRQATETAVDEMRAAQDAVRTALESALRPIADAMDQALAAADLPRLQSAIAAVPAAIRSFVDNDVGPALAQVRQAAETAVGTVQQAATQFDPRAVLAPVQAALEQLAAILSRPEVVQTIGAVRDALTAAAQVLAAFNLEPAANESIAIMGRIEEKLKKIDPKLIPDDAKPQLRQAVAFVTEIDFTATVGKPIVDGVAAALEAGPVAVLGAIEGEMDALKEKLDAFDPSQIVSADLDQPFQDLATTLAGFHPGQLFERAQAALDQAAQGIGMLDPAAAIAPLANAHAEATQTIASIRPSLLLKPVEQAAEAAVATLFREAHIDDALQGVSQLGDALTNLIAMAREAGDLLGRAAALLQNPGDPGDAAAALVREAGAKLDAVAMDRLAGGFASCAAAVQAIAADRLASDLAAAFRAAAGGLVPARTAAAALVAAAQGLDLPGLDELRAAGRRLDAFPAAARAQRLGVQAGELQQAMVDYRRLMEIEGSVVLADLATPPANAAALRAAVEASLRQCLQAPLETLARAVAKLTPYIGGAAQGVAGIVDALVQKLDQVLGDSGLAGAAQGVEEAAGLLRDLDLTPVTGPLDAIHARITTALAALDPAPILAALVAARDALADAAQLARLLPPADIAALEASWQAIVAAIRALSPTTLVTEVLMPPYRTALGAVGPVLELPGQLRALAESASRDLPDDVVAQLGRCEEAFDRMLRAIPLQDTGAPSVSASASVTVNA